MYIYYIYDILYLQYIIYYMYIYFIFTCTADRVQALDRRLMEENAQRGTIQTNMTRLAERLDEIAAALRAAEDLAAQAWAPPYHSNLWCIRTHSARADTVQLAPDWRLLP